MRLTVTGVGRTLLERLIGRLSLRHEANLVSIYSQQRGELSNHVNATNADARLDTLGNLAQCRARVAT
jgi:hypothetical protein